MLLDMENHLTLLSLNMSPFVASAADSPQNPPSANSPMQQQQQHQPPQGSQQQSTGGTYGGGNNVSPPLNANYAPQQSCQMTEISQQSQQSQQQLQQQQQQQQQNYSPNMMNYNLYNLDSSYLFSSSGLMEIGAAAAAAAAATGSNSGTPSPSHNNNNNYGGGSQLSAGSTSGGVVATTSLLPDGNTAPGTASVSGGGAVSGGTGVPGSGGAMPDTKFYIEELCPVCGDKVSGYHYGLLTCESCKGFFKRTVQNKKVYTCVAERTCHIDKTQRKRCPFCRFQKCLDVGMKLEAVRADRMRGGRNKFGPMYKRDRARKLQIMRQRQLAAQVLCGGSTTANGGVVGSSYICSTNAGSGTTGQSFASVHIKQEIQIPQVSSLTSSPDSSPSPISVALGQASLHHHHHHGGGGGSNSSSNNNTGHPNNNHNHHHSHASSAQGAPPLQIVAGTTTAGTTSSGGGGQQSTTTSSTTSSTATSLLLGSTDSKLWAVANSTTTSPHSLSPKTFQFDGSATTTGTAGTGGAGSGGTSGANSGGGASAPAGAVKVSPLIRDFVQAIDDREWQNSLYSLLQSQTYNQCEVDLFELMCKVLDQNLFSQVDWARNSIFFKDLKVDDQMKLLQHSWSDMLVLDHIHQRMHNNLPDETTLHNGQKFDLLNLGLLGVPTLVDHFNDITLKLQELKFDVSDYICVKFLLLLNPDVRGISNRKYVYAGYEQVQQALLEYTVTCYQNIQDKFNKLLQILPDIHGLATRGEEHLYMKHCNGSAPTQTLLMEMLHAKRK